MSAAGKLPLVTTISLKLKLLSLLRFNKILVYAKKLKTFKTRKIKYRRKLKGFFWRIRPEIYNSRVGNFEIPRLAFITSTLQATLMYRWKKKLFIKRKPKGLFRKARIKTLRKARAIKSKPKRFKNKRAKNYFFRGLIKRFKNSFYMFRKFLKKCLRGLMYFIAPSQNYLKRSRPSLNFSLLNRTHMNLKTLKKKFIGFLYKRPKAVLLKYIKYIDTEPQPFEEDFEKKRRTIFTNLHRQYIWKLRCARYVHWDLRTLGKLTEWRYQKLLGVEVYSLHRIKWTQFLVYIFIRCFCFAISWKLSKSVLVDSPQVYNGKELFEDTYVEKGDIVELPFGSAIVRARRSYKAYFRRLVGRAKKISYRSYLIRTKQLKHAKNYITVPKAFKKLPIGLKRFGKLVNHELITNAIAFIKRLPKLGHDITSKLNLTSVLALQAWRYRFD